MLQRGLWHLNMDESGSKSHNRTMKFILTLLVLVCAAPLWAQNVSSKLFNLVFDYPTAEYSTNITFRAHFSQGFALPLALTNWPVADTGAWIPESTNDVAGLITFVSSNQVMAIAPKTFFVVSASNEWGGLVFSDILATGPPARIGSVRLR